MNVGWSRGQSAAIVAVSVVVAEGILLTGDHSAGNFVFALLSVSAAAAVAWLTPSRPVVAFGILFLVASLSRGTIATPLGNMRLEQPAIVAGFAALLLTRPGIDIRRLRSLWPIGAAFGLYLACLTLSSVLFAPDRADSLRMTFWTGLSMAGGVLALLLLARGNARANEWILLSGYVQAIPAFVFAILFFSLGPVLIAGPAPAPGVQDPLSSLPKVFSLSWEANIYAAFLAALTPIGINRLLSGNRLVDKVLVPVMVAAIALGVTRGAYLGLIAGLAVYVVLAAAPRRLWDRRTLRRVEVWGTVIAGSFGAGLLLTAVLLAGGRQPTSPLDFTKPNWGRSPAAATGPVPAPAIVLSPRHGCLPARARARGPGRRPEQPHRGPRRQFVRPAPRGCVDLLGARSHLDPRCRGFVQIGSPRCRGPGHRLPSRAAGAVQGNANTRR